MLLGDPCARTGPNPRYPVQLGEWAAGGYLAVPIFSCKIPMLHSKIHG